MNQPISKLGSILASVVAIPLWGTAIEAGHRESCDVDVHYRNSNFVLGAHYGHNHHHRPHVVRRHRHRTVVHEDPYPCGGYYKHVWVAPVYQAYYDECGRRYRKLVRPSYYRMVWVLGHRRRVLHRHSGNPESAYTR